MTGDGRVTGKGAGVAAPSAGGSRPTSTTAEGTGRTGAGSRSERTSTASGTLERSSTSTAAPPRPNPLWSTPVAQFLELTPPQLSGDDLWVLGLAERQRLSEVSQGLGLDPTLAIDRLLRRLVYTMPAWASRPTYEAVSFYLQQLVLPVDRG